MKKILLTFICLFYVNTLHSETLEEMGAKIRQREKEREEHPELVKQKIEQISKEYLDCAKASTPILDDKISDASTIAIGLQQYCFTHLQALSDASGTKAREWGETYSRAVIVFVLTNRTLENRANKKH